jgi:hypothetical protein
MLGVDRLNLFGGGFIVEGVSLGSAEGKLEAHFV